MLPISGSVAVNTTSRKGITVVAKKDLQPGQAYGTLYCPSCAAEYSADSGDYWYLEDEYVFSCEECDVDMQLVKFRRVYDEVKS